LTLFPATRKIHWANRGAEQAKIKAKIAHFIVKPPRRAETKWFLVRKTYARIASGQ